MAIATAFLVTLLSSFAANAEGFWTNMRISGGAYYSEDEHSTISLEREALTYRGDSSPYPECKAYFLFRNTSENSVSLRVGFPLKILIPQEETYEFDPSHWVMRDFSMSGSSRNLISYEEFKAANRIGGIALIIRNLAIFQDGHKIPINSVLVETYKADPDTAVIQLHFLHQLDFQPDAYSNVLVEYSSFSSMIDTGSPETYSYINWRHILGTGNTWNDPIKTIYILVPDHLYPELPKSFNYVGDFKKHKIYVANNYEPLDHDEVGIRHISSSFGVIGDTRPMENPRIPAQSYVVLKGGSSYLSQKTWVNSAFTGVFPRSDPLLSGIYPSFYRNFHRPPESSIPSYVIEDLPITCKNIGFGPLSLFDGLPESAWCEGMSNDGIDEWVEFELEKEVMGMTIYNGFVKSPMFFLEYKEPEVIEAVDATYGDNNRASLIEFISEDGLTVQRIQLKDTPERQDFEDIYLSKGVYKMYIRNVYKGTRWDDTCLGEIEFHSASAKSIVEGDKFLKSVLIDH